MKVSRKLILVFVLVLVLAFAFTTVASAEGASECGKWFGQFHKSLAQSGATGQFHKPGIDHNGAVGLCGVGVGR